MWDFDGLIPTVMRCIIYWVILLTIIVWSECKDSIKKRGIIKSIKIVKKEMNTAFWLFVFLYFFPCLAFCILYFIVNLF